jgi:hypothetical protein
VGWIRFADPPTENLSVNVLSSQMQGYATSTAGDISLDCATTSIGNICNPPSIDYRVTNDNGVLSGYAWNDIYGWISMSCKNTEGSSCSSYGVTIDGATGDFSGYAWNDIIGWISFNCASTADNCNTASYKVNSTWRATSTVATLDSTIFDTGIAQGAQPNSIMWNGTWPANTSVLFQIASSNAVNGPWNYVGVDGTTATYYSDNTTGPGVSIPVSYTNHNNKRYLRYRTILVSNATSSVTPVVTDVVINWSR